jgi:hypothetical protein
MAPDALMKYNFFGRGMLQITPQFQSTLGPLTYAVIPAGTPIGWGLVGYQYGQPLGSWIQFYSPGTRFIPKKNF